LFRDEAMLEFKIHNPKSKIQNPKSKIQNCIHTMSSISRTFRISPLIRITLLLLYIALTLPLPILAATTAASVSPLGLAIAILLGFVLLYAALTERVTIDDVGISRNYPAWARLIWRKEWSLPWTEVKALKPRTTGQGGLVYYFLSQAGEGYLLPMRIAGFAEFVRQVQAKTGIDTQDVKPLAQPWMYLILLVLTIGLLAVDGLAIAIATGQAT
jgi:hypothetical protein